MTIMETTFRRAGLERSSYMYKVPLSSKKEIVEKVVFAFKPFLSQNFHSPCAIFPFTLKATGFIIQEPFPLVENGHPPVLVCSNRSIESRAYSAPLPRRLVGPTSAIR